jgi:glucosamine--fructose-6-phosphate aminotransferase (isomerizing)
MCGIVGYVGPRPVTPLVLDGLRRLEYRGYDSAGIAVVSNGVVQVARAEGKLGNLAARLEAEPLAGHYGMGHTRWATHGRPTEENAHPHRDCSGRIVVIHNGIIENFLALKRELAAKGHLFRTETDTEVVAHLIEEEMKGGKGFLDATRAAVGRLTGMYALVVLSADAPDLLVAVRQGPPIVLGAGEEGERENFVASDVTALLPYTRRMIFLEDGDFAVLVPDRIEITAIDGRPVERPIRRINWDAVAAEKGGFRHFMQKEIHEQPQAIRDTLTGRVNLETGEVIVPEIGLGQGEAKRIDRIQIVACGTAWHAGLVGKFLLEQALRIPVGVDYASEFRYRDPVVDARTLAIAVSQSGETADTVAALAEAKRRGAMTAAICNVPGSQVTRLASGTLQTHAGPEIGVASTKAFTTQLAAFVLLTHALRQLRGAPPSESLPELEALARLPLLVEQTLRVEPKVEEMARRHFKARDFLFLGRGIQYPIALEGALKLKEISYIHAEGYPAGEMKHGPIALIDENMPVVALAPKGPVYDKVVSNLMETKARDAIVLAIADEGDEEISEVASEVIRIPTSTPNLQPILTVVPLQLLAYHVACRLGCDVDQPRNLAKSVTVE